MEGRPPANMIHGHAQTLCYCIFFWRLENVKGCTSDPPAAEELYCVHASRAHVGMQRLAPMRPCPQAGSVIPLKTEMDLPSLQLQTCSHALT